MTVSCTVSRPTGVRAPVEGSRPGSSSRLREPLLARSARGDAWHRALVPSMAGAVSRKEVRPFMSRHAQRSSGVEGTELQGPFRGFCVRGRRPL